MTCLETVITERGQISVPAMIRKQFHLKPGMGMMWIVRGDAIFLLPVPEDPIGAFQRHDADPAAFDGFMADRARDRAKERAQDLTQEREWVRRRKNK